MRHEPPPIPHVGQALAQAPALPSHDEQELWCWAIASDDSRRPRHKLVVIRLAIHVVFEKVRSIETLLLAFGQYDRRSAGRLWDLGSVQPAGRACGG
jgi:hypothetical protein